MFQPLISSDIKAYPGPVSFLHLENFGLGSYFYVFCELDLPELAS